MIAKGWGDLLDLIGDLLEGRLSEEGADRLAVWLSVDEDAQSIYLRALQLHAELTLALCEEDESGPRTNPHSDNQALTQLSEAVCGIVTSATAEPNRNESSPKRTDLAASGDHSLFRMFSRRLLLASLATFLTMVAVFGSERIVNGVLALRWASTAATKGGMLAAGVDQKTLYHGPNRSRGTRRIGSSRSEGVALASIFLFPLPGLQELEQIETARIEWTCKEKDHEPQFAVDLYGLGYMQPNSSGRVDFWEGSNDTSLRIMYGMSGSPSRTVAFLKRAAMNPQTACGRVKVESRNLVRFLQSLYDDGAKKGDFAVFRLNADRPTSSISRETGYAVVHPPAVAKLTQSDELPALVLTAKSRSLVDKPVVAKAVMAAHSILGHWSGGLVRSSNNLVQPGCNGDGIRRIGSSTVGDVGLANVIMFSLPSIEKVTSLVSARLEWTCMAKDGDPHFSVDLYGLGYVRGQAYHGPCFWEGVHDPSTAADYALQGAPQRPVTLVARGVMNPDTSCGRVTVENTALISFLRSIYEGGAREGDLIVFRLNADSSTLKIPRSTGYDIAHAPDIPGITSPSDLPVLLMTFN